MIKGKKKIWFILLVIVCCLLSSCVNKTEVTKEEKKKSVPRIDIANVDEAFQSILESSTAEFIGNYAVDDSFLGWFVNQYGEEKLQEIASYALSKEPNIWYDTTGKSIHVLWWEYCKQIGFVNLEQQRILEIPCNSENEVSISFSGDIIMANDVAVTNYMLEQGYELKDCFCDQLLNEMKQVDLMVINNEFTYTTRGEPYPNKAYSFRGDPVRAKELYGIGADLVSLANNHVYDYGEIGLLDTLDTLDGIGMNYIGAGRDLNEAKRPMYYIANGKKIAIVAATQIERSLPYTKQATEVSAGVLKTLDPSIFTEVIQEAKKTSDYVLVFVHWGTEGNANYGQDQRKLAEAFEAAGADVIIGGHTHCLQGMEYINDCLVYYSLGDYLFSRSSNMPEDYNTGLAQIAIQKDGSIVTQFLPCKFSQGQTCLIAQPEEQIQLYQYLQNISSGVSIDDQGLITPLGE